MLRPRYSSLQRSSKSSSSFCSVIQHYSWYPFVVHSLSHVMANFFFFLEATIKIDPARPSQTSVNLYQIIRLRMAQDAQCWLSLQWEFQMLQEPHWATANRSGPGSLSQQSSCMQFGWLRSDFRPNMQTDFLFNHHRGHADSGTRPGSFSSSPLRVG